MATVEDLGGVKDAGQLVKHEDWNAIVAEVVRLEADKADNTRVDALEAAVFDPVTGLVKQIEDLTTAVTGLQGRVDALEAIRDQYFQLTLETASLTFAVGTQAEITARLRDLEGNPVAFPVAADRPWVDFVATWGRFAPAAGFTVRGGVHDQTMSVRVDADGVARVILRPETVVGLAENDVVRMADAMLMEVHASPAEPLSQVIVNAATPTEAEATGAFELLRTEYDAVGGSSVRRYMDAAYQYQWQHQPGFDVSVSGNNFIDYRSMVLAFVKADGDPRTPDQSRGASSIQITFRDWIWSWAWGHYFEAVDDLVVDFRGEVLEAVADGPTVGVAAGRYSGLYDTFLAGKGIIEKERNLQAMIDVLDDTTLPGPQSQYQFLLSGSKDALGLQLALDRGRGEAAKVAAVKPVLETAARGEEAVAGLNVQIAGAEARAAAAEAAVDGLQVSVASVGGQVEGMLAEGGTLTAALQRVDSIDQQLQDLNVQILAPTETKVSEIDTKVLQAFERIAILEQG